MEFEDLDLVNDETDRSMDFIAIPIPELPIRSSEKKSVFPLHSQEDLRVEFPHIDFIFGDEQRMVKVCDMIIQIPHLKHQFSQLHTQSESCHKAEKKKKA